MDETFAGFKRGDFQSAIALFDSYKQTNSVERLLIQRQRLHENKPIETKRFLDGLQVSIFKTRPYLDPRSRIIGVPSKTLRPAIQARILACPIYEHEGVYTLELLDAWVVIKGDLNGLSELINAQDDEEFLRLICPCEIRIDHFELTKPRDKRRLEEGLSNNKISAALGNADSRAYELVNNVDTLFGYDFVIATLKQPSTVMRLVAGSRWSRGRCGGTPVAVRPQVPGTETSWAQNPQFLLDLRGFQGEVSVDVVLTTAKEEEIFVCLMEGDQRLEKFEKSRILKSGGASMLRIGKAVTLAATTTSPGRYVLVPSTWKVDLELDFRLYVIVSGNDGFLECSLRQI